MKNLLIFVDPAKDFNREHKTLVRVQIDWSLEMGWKKDDILLVTNFPYEYNGVSAFQVEDDCYYPPFNRATKIPVINRLYEKGMINEQFWFHDFDAFQLVPFEIKSDLAITLYGKNSKGTSEKKWNAGSFFFNKAQVTFRLIEDCMRDFTIDEENALLYMIEQGFKDFDELDNSWCVHIYNKKIENPKVVHFHPYKHLYKFKDILPVKFYEKLNDIYPSRT